MDADTTTGPRPIAVVGMSCRMPGNVRNPDDLWTLLMSKRIANTHKVPASRFAIDSFYHPNKERPGSFNISGGYFLEDDIQAFDPGMFELSPVEAMWMDPQQRKVLEVVYEAFESGGIPLEKIAGTKTGCYVGSFSLDFQHMATREPDFRHAYMATGSDPGILSSRVSHLFDLKGPSMMVNTACSSSLYALHLACEAMRNGECESAVVAGVNLILSAEQQMNTARMGVLSPTKQSHTFDEAADGYGRAEGLGALFLKPLDEALKAGDPIRAVVRSTALNFNGKSKGQGGVTRPSREGQMEVIEAAYARGNLDPKHTSYVECHGTGTPVGDPIEIQALQDFMGVSRTAEQPLLIGSVKPNIGHSEAASSIATLIKTILSLENGIIAPTAGITQLSSSIPWKDLNLQVVQEPTRFPSFQSIKRIGVSAFGYGGTNAHAILDSVDDILPSDYRRHKSIKHPQGVPNGLDHTDPNADLAHLILLSAHDESTLRNNVADLKTIDIEHAPLLDLAYTLGLKRTKFTTRGFAVVRKDTFQGDIEAATTRIVSRRTNASKVAFVFTGQGAQWPQMGVTLLHQFPSFKQTIQQLDTHLSKLSERPSWTIQSILTETDETSVISQPEFSQPLCTAIQIALVDLLKTWGLQPSATIGHSSGEIAAAYASGRLSARNAITAAYYRGKVAADLRSDGAMLAVGLGAEEASRVIDEADLRGKVIVACHNSPKAVTLSGDGEAVEELKKILDGKRVFAKIVWTGGKAYHSHHMKAAAEKYLDYLHREAEALSNDVMLLDKAPMFSTVQAKEINDESVIPESYWVENLNSPVLFNQGLQLLLNAQPDVDVLVEVGPHGALSGPIRQICQEAGKSSVTYFSTLKRKENDVDQIFSLAGSLWSYNVALDIEALISVQRLERSTEGNKPQIQLHKGRFLVELPTYHWTYPKTLWPESRHIDHHREVTPGRHDILGRRVLGTSKLAPVWRNILRQKDIPWLPQHSLAGEVMLPGMGYLALAMEAIMQINDESDKPLEVHSFTVRDVEISTATVIPDDDTGTETLFSLLPLGGNSYSSSDKVPSKASQWYQFTASCSSYGAWNETAKGQVALNVRGRSSDNDPKKLPATPDSTPSANWYQKLEDYGITLGPAFQHFKNIYSDGKTYTARANLDISKDCGLMEGESRYVLHPTVLDTCLQLFTVSIHQGRIDNLRCGTIPTNIEEVTVFIPSAEQLQKECTMQLWTPKPANRAYNSNSQLIAHDGALLVDLTNCRHLLYHAAVPQHLSGNQGQDLYMKLDWKPDADFMQWAIDGGALEDKQCPLVEVVDLFLHKDPSASLLCLDDSLHHLIGDSQPKKTVLGGMITGKKEVTIHGDGPKQDFDLIVGPRMLGFPNTSILSTLRQIMAKGGRLLIQPGAEVFVDSWTAALKESGFSGIECTLPDNAGIIVTAIEPADGVDDEATSEIDSEKEIVLIYRQSPPSSIQSIVDTFDKLGWNVIFQPIKETSNLDRKRVVLLADLEGPLLSDLAEDELNSVITITEKATSLIWVTCGGLLTGDRPEFGATQGAARAIRHEKAGLDLVTIDFDPESTPIHRVADLLTAVIQNQQNSGRDGEREYYLHNGVVHVGRFKSHVEVNRAYVPTSGELSMVHYRDSPAVRAEVDDGKITYHSDETFRESVPLLSDEVEVRASAIGLSEQDGADESPFLNHQVAGTVTRIGDGVSKLSPGMRVFGVAFGKLETFQRTKATLVHLIPARVSFAASASLPLGFATAVHALEDLARVDENDKVVIVTDYLSVTAHAAAQVCFVAGASLTFVTSSSVSDDSIRDLTDRYSGCRVVSSVDDKSLRSLELEADVLIYAERMNGSSIIRRCARKLADYARIVAINTSGTKSVVTPALQVSCQGAANFEVDIVHLAQHRPKTVSRALKRCIRLLGESRIATFGPVIGHDVSKVRDVILSPAKAVNQFMQVLNYEDASFQVAASPSPLRFRSDVTYLLVGCLGGLGRAVALWMANKGAKHMSFLSRSGAKAAAAAETVKTLEARGVIVQVLTANITDREQLVNAVAQIDPSVPVRGVVNAATLFRDSLFQNMTIDKWRDVIDTKVRGCINLHEVVKDMELDFFVMTGTMSSTWGSSGQTNYGAANSVFDSLALHRRHRGLPAVNLILPAIFGIGYIAENPEIENSIKVKGMYGIYEKEMLESFDIAMRPQSSLPTGLDHIIVGMQPQAFGRSLKASGAYVHWAEDPRLRWLEIAVNESQGGYDKSSSKLTGSTESMRSIINGPQSQDEALDDLAAQLSRRLSRLLVIDEESLQPRVKSVASYGIDSMIGAEFRNWILRQSGVDVPFQQLLAGNLTIYELARLLYDQGKGA